MAIIVKKQVIIDGDGYQNISAALEFARRHIKREKRAKSGVDEYDAKEVLEIEAAMAAFWE